ncbi:MAG: hypothetical protein GY756_28075, partial [bacterium]|nr:hypothetical protein [bacterium]
MEEFRRKREESNSDNKTENIVEANANNNAVAKDNQVTDNTTNSTTIQGKSNKDINNKSAASPIYPDFVNNIYLEIVK